MKTTAKILFLFLSVSVASVLYAQTCTPMTNFPSSQGTYPLEMDRAIIHETYSAIIHYKAPTDTTGTVGGQTITVTVDSLRITNVLGLPAGFTYECHNANCMVSGGGVGCVKITGAPTPSQIGTYPLKVIVKMRGRFPLFGLPVQIPESLQYDTNFRYTLVVGYHTALNKIQASTPMIVYPNPAKDEVNIQLGSAIKEEGFVYVRDLQGKIVLMKKLDSHEITLNTQQLPRGLYLLEVQALQGSYRNRLMLE